MSALRRPEGLAPRDEREHRETHRVVVRAVAIVAVTAAGAAWLAAKGPMKAIVGTTEIDEISPTWYMLSAFPILGMVVGDVFDALLEHGVFATRTVLLGASAALLVVVSNLRLGVRLPISGHVLLMTYFLAARTFARASGARPTAPLAVKFARLEVGIAAALLVLVTAMKLLHWKDWTTFSIGIAGGAALASLVAYFLKTPRTPPATSAVTSRSTDGSSSPPGAAR